MKKAFHKKINEEDIWIEQIVIHENVNQPTLVFLHEGLGDEGKNWSKCYIFAGNKLWSCTALGTESLGFENYGEFFK